jgi:hypothetical protein
LIAVLVALTAGVAWNVVDSQRAGRTDDAIRTIDKVFRTHWKKVIDDADKEDIPPAVVALAVGDMARARVLLKKLRLSEAFPESYSQVISAATLKGAYAGKYAPGTIPQASYYQTYALFGGPLIPLDRQRNTSTYYNAIANAGTSSNPNPLIPQSAALLLLALSQNRGGNNKIDLANMANNLLDSDGDGVKELVDNWNQPLRFVRFPIYTTPFTNDPADAAQVAQYLSLDPRAQASQKRASEDPLDPYGTLQEVPAGAGSRLPWFRTVVPQTIATTTLTYGQFFTAICNHPFGANNRPQPYWTSIIASSGSDGVPYNGDDHYNFRLAVGAQGN